MANDGWTTMCFDHCADLIRDIIQPNNAYGLPYIGLEHIAEGQLTLTGHGYADQVTSVKSRFRKGDILFGKLRPYFRKVVIAPFDGICSTDTWVVRQKQGIDQRYLFYWMASREFIEESTRASEGTRMPRAQWEFVGRLEKPVPPLREQRAIAHILGALDDKIELNRRISETLEQMARALFKSWFVDFDPVRAKMNLPSPPGTKMNLPSPPGRGAGGEGNTPAVRHKLSLPSDLREFARQLRGSATDAESLMWRLLRGRQIADAKFRRQHPVAPYILDFYCHEFKLAVELDGGQHNEAANRQHDVRRSDFLAERGIRVLRFWNNDVLKETVAVLETIYAVIVECSGGVPSPPAPLPEREESVGLPQHIADLFPNAFEDSELGEIPEGWEVGNVSDLGEVICGKTPPTKNPENYGDDIPFITIPDMHGKVFVTKTGKSLSTIGANTQAKKILPPKSICVSCIATLGLVVLTSEKAQTNQQINSIIPKELSPYYCYQVLHRLGDQIRAGGSGGSVFFNLNKTMFSKIKVLLAEQHVIDTYHKAVERIFERLLFNERESYTLAALRDTLLPKLLSGELRILDFEKLRGNMT
ncbi:MAG: hypothetical protein DDT33_00859 [Firmicutes bacterium]|nr:hypothetical protein [Bacillota bacterium]